MNHYPSFNGGISIHFNNTDNTSSSNDDEPNYIIILNRLYRELSVIGLSSDLSYLSLTNKDQ